MFHAAGNTVGRLYACLYAALSMFSRHTGQGRRGLRGPVMLAMVLAVAQPSALCAAPVFETGGHGTIQIDSGGKLIADTVEVFLGGKIVGDGGILQATTRLKSGGYIQPGLSPGTLTIDGDFEQTGGTLQIEFAGLGEGQFDVLVVTGNATLGGIVEMIFLDGYAPKTGEVLSFLEVGGNVSGQFAEFVFPNLLPDFEFETSFSDGAFSLMALNDALLAPDVLAGDFNDDGRVDAADYTVWRDGLGVTHGSAQYDQWKNNFGATIGAAGASSSLAGSPQAAVPEPAGLVLFASAVLATLLQPPPRRRFRRACSDLTGDCS